MFEAPEKSIIQALEQSIIQALEQSIIQAHERSINLRNSVWSHTCLFTVRDSGEKRRDWRPDQTWFNELESIRKYNGLPIKSMLKRL